MRAAGLLPLLLLLGVSSQDDADPAATTSNATTESTTKTIPANTSQTTPISQTTVVLSPTTQETSTATSEKGSTQGTVATSAQTATTAATITITNPGTSSSSIATSPAPENGTTSAASGTTSTDSSTAPAHTSGQDSSSHTATAPTASSAASPTASQQPSSTMASSGGSGNITAAKPVLANATSPPGTAGAAATISLSTQPQGEHLSNTTVSPAVPRTDPSQSSKECAVPSPPCATKLSPSSSSSPVQTPIPSTSSGSISTSVTPLTGSTSLTTPLASQPGSKDRVPEKTTTAAPGADQSIHDVRPTPAKPTSASQSPPSAQTVAPAQGNQTKSCSSGHQHPNISSPNELKCEDQVPLTGPTIHLKVPRTCAEWMAASNNISFFESFCSTAQHAFDASRDRCTVTLTACEPQSQDWGVWVLLHVPLDTEEVFKGLKEKNEKLEELGIVNITSDKMVEDMTINDEFSTPLIITIITLAGSLLLIAAIYGCHQRYSQKKDQNIHPDVPGFDDGHVALIFNRLTEEMQTMENGYHDNPTLEVMETSSEMQEKKVNLNGELGDSWIVPLDTLMKEDLEEEEDTHL